LKIKFIGAAQQVTGSMYQITDQDSKIYLVDCGLSYEKDQDYTENRNFPFDPAQIDAVILTHAHVDHSGNIPTLYAQGFRGSVFCTEPTFEIVKTLLLDSAHLQKSKANRKAKKSKKNVGKMDEDILYNVHEVTESFELFVTLPFEKTFTLSSTLKFSFFEAGHILGAASIRFEYTQNTRTKSIGFTGDLGPNHTQIIVPPKPLKNLNYLVMEGTYGNRFRKSTNSPEDELMMHIQKTCIDRRGRLVIPAFSVGRTQSILFTLNKLYREGRLGNLRVFTDSPLGMINTEIHKHFRSFLNKKAIGFNDQFGSLFQFPNLYTVEDKEDKDEMDNYAGASILVSSAGMVVGGRVQQHVKSNLNNPQSTILIAGFCAPGTLGRELLDNKGKVWIKGKEHYVYCQIAQTDVFSAHPDLTGLIEYCHSVFSNSDELEKIFLTHGEFDSLENLKKELHKKNRMLEIEIPNAHQECNI